MEKLAADSAAYNIAVMAAATTKDHHYIPRGYLKRWATGTEGTLCTFYYHPRGLAYNWRSPAQTGYKPHLYTAKLNPQFGDRLEREFFQGVDDDASKLIDLFTSGPIPELDPRQRDAWTRFLMSLMHRSPEGVAKIGEKFAEILARTPIEITDSMRAEYAAKRIPEHPEALEDYLAMMRPRDIEIGTMMSIANISNLPDAGTTINAMTKRVFHLKGSKHELLTCDRPLIMTNGLGDPTCILMLAIGPRHLFVATHSEQRMQDVVANIDSGGVTKFNNQGVCERAEQFVYATSPTQESFVRKYFRLINPTTNPILSQAH